MTETHITTLLEGRPLHGFSEEEIAAAESHVARCSDCKRRYDAARVSAALIEARASETALPGPFFRTRVMAAVRERRLSPKASALARMWRAAGALASMLGALLVILVALTMFTSDSDVPSTVVSESIYSPEYVVLEQGDLDDEEVAYDEVVATMYEAEDGDGQ